MLENREVFRLNLLYCRVRVALAAFFLGVSIFSACAGGSLLRPTPLIGRDRLVYRIVDQASTTTYYTRNVWFDGDNYRFHDVYGRDVSITKTDQVQVDIISMIEYYKTPQ
ncbi:MAG TPA: hypothetical protein VJ417_17205 [Candidatus Glassbacteria bacterium]|nr:hypothetical protein [Candidatus Glassbacteria bacterium]